MLYMRQISISQEVTLYLKRKPYIQESLEQDIVNYSALARKIAAELGNIPVEAVKSAIIRTSRKLRIEKMDRDLIVRNLLQKAHFSIENKIATIHHSSFVDIEAIAYSKTPSGYMYFVKETKVNKSKFTKIEYGFAIIRIRSTKAIEETPGVASFLLSTLAMEGINVAHLMDCREDTFLVVKEHDAPLAYKILAERLAI
jgi:aspartokinase